MKLLIFAVLSSSLVASAIIYWGLGEIKPQPKSPQQQLIEQVSIPLKLPKSLPAAITAQGVGNADDYYKSFMSSVIERKFDFTKGKVSEKDRFVRTDPQLLKKLDLILKRLELCDVGADMAKK